VVIAPGSSPSLLLPATGPVMGIQPGAQFPSETKLIPFGAYLFIFSDGVFEIRRDSQVVWNLSACTDYLASYGGRGENVMDSLLARVHELRGSAHLDDDFSIIEARLR
jgi:serine phosphatase RsbU (regulator of sigma subunit)